MIGLMTLISCKANKVTSSKETKITDSVITIVSFEDTTIVIPASTITLDGVIVNVDSNNLAQLDPVIIDNKDMNIKVSIKDGKLKAESTKKESIKQIQIPKKTIINKTKEETKEVINTVKEIKHTPLIVKIFAWLGLLVLMYILIRIYLKFKPL